MSLWTPGGEVPVNRSTGRPAEPTEPDPLVDGATGFVDGPHKRYRRDAGHWLLTREDAAA